MACIAMAVCVFALVAAGFFAGRRNVGGLAAAAGALLVGSANLWIAGGFHVL